MFALRLIDIVSVVWCHPSKTFYVLLCDLWLVTMPSDVTDVWHHDPVTLILVLRIEKKIVWKEYKNKNKMKMKLI